MKKEEIFVFSLGWIAANIAQLIQLLQALFPVIVVIALGYAIHVIARGKDTKNDPKSLLARSSIADHTRCPSKVHVGEAGHSFRSIQHSGVDALCCFALHGGRS